MAAVAAQLPLRVDPHSINACPGEPDVEFVRDAHASLCAVRGPEDAVRRAHAEIELRAFVFVAEMERYPLSAPLPRIQFRQGPFKRWGQCDSCGVELPSYVGGMCNPCGAGYRKALRDTGRLQ